MATQRMKKYRKKSMVKREVKRDMKLAKVKAPKGKAKVKKVMEEFKSGELRSGSKKGPRVTNPKQAIAIALSEARRKKKK